MDILRDKYKNEILRLIFLHGVTDESLKRAEIFLKRQLKLDIDILYLQQKEFLTKRFLKITGKETLFTLKLKDHFSEAFKDMVEEHSTYLNDIVKHMKFISNHGIPFSDLKYLILPKK